MKKVVLLIAVILLNTTHLIGAEDKKLAVTLDVRYSSKYIDKGGEYFGSKSAISETLYLDLYNTGFGLLTHNRRANSSGFENKQKFKYGAYYKNSLFGNETYKTKYKFTWYYHNYYDEPRNKSNKDEWIFDFLWPNLLPGGLVPQYTTWYMYPAGSSYDNRDLTGWLHRFGLNYDLTIPKLNNRIFKLCGYVWYRDGMGGKAKDHDWSHATFGISTQYKITENISFIPAVYYQSSWEDSVNKRDMLYTYLRLRLKF